MGYNINLVKTEVQVGITERGKGECEGSQDGGHKSPKSLRPKQNERRL